jgi:hypothetical protein
LSIAALVQETACRRSFDGQARTGQTAGQKIRPSAFRILVLPNHLDSFDLAASSLRDDELRELLSEKRTCAG